MPPNGFYSSDGGPSLYLGDGDAVLFMPAGTAFFDFSLEGEILRTVQRLSREERRTRFRVEGDDLLLFGGQGAIVTTDVRLHPAVPRATPHPALLSLGHRAAHFGTRMVERKDPPFMPFFLDEEGGVSIMSGSSAAEALALAANHFLARRAATTRAAFIYAATVTNPNGQEVEVALACVAIRGVGREAFFMAYDGSTDPARPIGFGGGRIDASLDWFEL